MNVNSDLLNLNSKSPAFSITIEGKDVTDGDGRAPDESDTDG
ncbi:phage late control D family protein [Salmonella enterica subsp. houtenae]|nr:phage late control D family protein [Salmonella enterica subsp. houtenae]